MSSQYKTSLRQLQIHLVKLQRRIIDEDKRVLVLFEGRDSSGKDGVIKRITAHLSPREFRVVALGKPTDRDSASWYFQRYTHHLPADGEMVLFNRSWYNRAGVEKVMGFCDPEQHERFLRQVLPYERMLVDSGTVLLKYFLDISHEEQAERLAARRGDPLKQWKISPIDAVALDHWDAYTQARDEMLTRTHTREAPWWVVRTDDKREARLNVIRHLLSQISAHNGGPDIEAPDDEVVFAFSPERLPHDGKTDGKLSRLAP